MKSKTIPYTYVVSSKTLQKSYYGVRYKGNPDDLGVTYFTSSETVKSLIALLGKDDFEFQVRKTFTNAAAAINYETKVLRRLCNKSDKWINRVTANNLGAEELNGKLFSIKNVPVDVAESFRRIAESEKMKHRDLLKHLVDFYLRYAHFDDSILLSFSDTLDLNESMDEIKKDIRAIMSYTKLKKRDWLLVDE